MRRPGRVDKPGVESCRVDECPTGGNDAPTVARSSMSDFRARSRSAWPKPVAQPESARARLDLRASSSSWQARKASRSSSCRPRVARASRGAAYQQQPVGADRPSAGHSVSKRSASASSTRGHLRMASGPELVGHWSADATSASQRREGAQRFVGVVEIGVFGDGLIVSNSPGPCSRSTVLRSARHSGVRARRRLLNVGRLRR